MPTPSTGQQFNFTIFPRNKYDQEFVYFEEGDYFVVDFTKGCRKYEPTQKYCGFYSHSKTSCSKTSLCFWRHSGATGRPNYGSCGECLNPTGEAYEYEIEVTRDNAHYFVYSAIPEAGVYTVSS